MPKKRLASLLILIVALIVPSSAMASFGLRSFDVTWTNQDGSPDTQAGSHPFQMTTSFGFNAAINSFEELAPEIDLKNTTVDLPPGLTGSATAVPQCPQELFTRDRLSGGNASSCPATSAVGIAAIELLAGFTEVVTAYVSVYSLVPPPGVPAEFGVNFAGVPIVLVPSVRTGGDYGLRVESKNTSQALQIFGVAVTIWGVPGDPGHDGVRGLCLNEVTGGSTGEKCPANIGDKPLLTLPTSCSGPLVSVIHVDSWQEPAQTITDKSVSHDNQGHPVGIHGCNRLDFSPSLAVQPDTSSTDSPAGLEVNLRVPQNESPEGLAEADLRKVLITLPSGVLVSPSAANGLEACTEAQIALHSPEPAECPNASKVGSVKVETPLLEHHLEGSVYVAQQGGNPFESLLAVYLVVEGSGVRVKLAGKIAADPATGQLTTRFEELPKQQLSFPQLPFSDLKLRLFGGPRAALVTPQTCGTYQATGLLTPWSSEVPGGVMSSPPFPINAGCTSQFDPSFVAGTTSTQAAGFSPFTATFSRTDQDQDFKEVTVKTPPGLLGMLSRIPLCGEPQAELGTCPAASQIGHVTVGAGAGPDPIFLPQPGRAEDPVYLTGPYNGAPFGLSIVDHAEAGPFNLGPVIVRAAVSVDPHTAQVIVRSQPLPQILQGISLQIKTVNVTVNREGFIFNPTNCQPLTLNSTVVSTHNATAYLSSRFQATNCATLAFNPKFTAFTQGKASHANGASLDVKVGYPKGAQANIASVKVLLPKQLPSRLTTIQKACTEATFNANPAGCPAASNIGTATANSPVLNTPLTGPAYLVSRGGAAFPDIVIILQGQGVTLDLVGNTNISKGVTTSTFAAVPDAPISSFELKLPEGPHSALTSNLPVRAKRSFCATKLTMPTTITAQNGARITQNTKIAVAGCPRKRLTRSLRVAFGR